MWLLDESITMKRLYLDVCTYCRPFDDQNFLRIRLETDAFYLITQYIKQEKYQAVVSPVQIIKKV